MRFNGTMYITWSAFQAGDTSNIATANETLPIVNGVLNVALVPTTTASAGAQYNVTYNQNGVNQFTQVWAVPPSTTVPAHSRRAGVHRHGGGAGAGNRADRYFGRGGVEPMPWR